MVKAIDFAVRTSAGKVVNGAVSGDGGSQFLQVGSGETVSLNLSQSSVLGFERQGSDLVMKLADGREITLSGYFESNPGEDNKLYLSSNGDVTEVFLTDGGDGTMYANYGPVDTWNKYSNVDDIRFVEENNLVADGYNDDTVGMGAFAPGLLGGGGGGLGLAAAGLGGLGLLGALGGGGGGGGGTPGGGGGTVVPATPVRIPPTVNEPATSKDISTVTPDKTVVVTGTGQPGETVVVKVGDKTQTTTITEDGKWDTKFEGPNFPGDGTYEAVVTVTPATGTPDVLDGPGFVIDMTPPAVSTTAGTFSASDVENLAEYNEGTGGVTVKGEGEAGAKIVVTVAGGSQPTTVGSDGKWEVTFTQTQITGGDYKEIPVTITATDAMGNVTTINDSIAIDTVPHSLGFNTVAGDNVVSKLESDGTVTVTGTVSGTASGNALVTVTLDGGAAPQTVTAVNGTWTTTYAPGTFSGNNNRTFTATTTDAAGNPSTQTTHTIKVDTTASVNFTAGNLPGDVNGLNGLGDGKLNATETTNGVTMTGKAEIGSQSVTVVWNNYVKTLAAGDIDSNGNWSVNFAKSEMPFQPGNAAITSTATVTAIDQYGNQSPIDTKQVTIDTKTSVTFDPNQSGGDNIISASEAGNNVKLTGTAESGASVEVTYRGAPHTVTAGPNGKWEATFTTAELKVGGMQNGVWVNGVTDMTDGSATQVQVRATDGAGNVVSTTGYVQIDTEVPLTAGTNSYNTLKADNILNNAEAGQGLTVSGTVEAGSVVNLKLGSGAMVQALVTGETWTYTFTGSQIPGANNTSAVGGAITADLVVTATDALGNTSAPYRETIAIDRTVTPFNLNGTIGGDGILNATEVAKGVTLTGDGEVGANVKVILSNGQSETYTVGANGKWTVTFDHDQLPSGNNEKLNFKFEATDKAGNFTSFDVNNITVDTVAPDTVDVINFSKNVAGTMLTGVDIDQTISGSGFSFHRVGADGSQAEITLKNGSVGSDSASFSNNLVPEGDFLVINHEDAAGNGAATLFLTNNTGTSTINLSNTALQDFDFTQLDLSVAKTNMTISAQQLIAITGPENTLMIKGGTDDSVTMLDATKAADQTASPVGFTLYTLGDGAASIYLDDDIQRPNF